MIFDGENTFFHKKELSAAEIVSDAVQVGNGETGEPMWLVLTVGSDKAPAEGTIQTVLETSDTEDFANAVTLGTYTKLPLQIKVPRGNLKYLRIKATSTFTAGNMTAGLLYDDDVPWK